MSVTKKKILMLIAVVIIFLIISPFSFFKEKNTMNITVEHSSGKTDSTVLKNKSLNMGIFTKSRLTFDDHEFISKKTSLINLGIYTRVNHQVDFQTFIGEEEINIYIDSKSVFWGLGNRNIKRNASIQTVLDEIDNILESKTEETTTNQTNT